MLKKIQDLETQAKCLLDDNQQKLLIKKPLSQLEEESKRLRKKMPQKVVQNQYHNKITRNINKLKTYKLKQQMGTLEEREPTDITGYLNDNYKNILVFSWKEAIQETEKRFQERMDQSMQSEWEKNKRKLLSNIEYGYNNLKTDKSYLYSTPSKRPNPSTPVSTPGKNYTMDFSTPIKQPNLLGDNILSSPFDYKPSHVTESERSVVEKYSQGVANFLKNEKTSDPLAVIKHFAYLSEKTISNEKNQSILSICWRLLTFMFSNTGKIEDVRESFAKSSKSTCKLMVENTKNFLEDQYAEYVKNVLLSNGITRGGNPNEHKTISLFADFVVKRKDQVKKRDSNFAPFWAVVYYLIRIGKKEEAKRIILESDIETPIKECFKYYCASPSDRNKFDKKHLENVSKIYKETKTESVYLEDQKYKLAVLNIINRCENINVTKVSQSNMQQTSTFKQLTRDIFRTTEDFIWLQLNFVDETEGMLGGNDNNKVTFPLSTLQDTLKKFETRFKEHSPLLYFQVLLMSQQFDLALSEINHRDYFIEATHFAVVFEYLGVLKNTSFSYPLHIHNYVKLYHDTNQHNSLRYYYTIRNEKARNIYLYDLLSKDFNYYFGDDKSAGALVQFYQHYDLNVKEIQQVKLYCAYESEKKSRLSDAVQLFFSCKEFDKVFELLVKILIPVLLDFSLPSSENTLKFANGFLDRMPRNPSSIYSSCLQILLKFYSFYFYYNKADYQNAISEAEKTNLVSLEINNVIDRQRANILRNHSPVIGKVISDFLKKISNALNQLISLSKPKQTGVDMQYTHKRHALVNFCTYFKEDENIRHLDIF